MGVSNLFLVDSSRPETLTENSNDLRQVPLTIWYPARIEQNIAKSAYMPGLDFYRAGFMVDNREIVRSIGQRFDKFACVQTHSYPDAPIAETNDAFPLIVFSPGGLMSRFFHTIQAQDLASQGFVFVAIGHHYSGTDAYPVGGLDFDPMLWRATDDMSEEEAFALDDALTDMLASDATFALDQMAEIHDGAIEHELNGRIDFSRVAILGHSRGGSTVARACARDDRFGACVTYDNIGPDREVESGIAKPQLSIRMPWDEDREKVLSDYQRKNPSWAVDAVIMSSGHFTFSDLEFVDPENYSSEGDTIRNQRLSTELTRNFLFAIWGEAFDAFDARSTEDVLIKTNSSD